MSLKDKYRAEMQEEFHPIGFLGSYLNQMRAENPKGSDSLEADIIQCFTSEQGLRVLKLFEKSVSLATLKNGSSDCALRELNATRNFVAEIRRIVAHGR